MIGQLTRQMKVRRRHPWTLAGGRLGVSETKKASVQVLSSDWPKRRVVDCEGTLEMHDSGGNPLAVDDGSCSFILCGCGGNMNTRSNLALLLHT